MKNIIRRILKPVLLILAGIVLAFIYTISGLFTNLSFRFFLFLLFVIALILGYVFEKRGWVYCLMISIVVVICVIVLAWFIVSAFAYPLPYTLMTHLKERWSKTGDWESVWISCTILVGIIGAVIGELLRLSIKRIREKR